MRKRLYRKMSNGGRFLLRLIMAWLPRSQRQRVIRASVQCHLTPSPRLVLKIAETREELEACFAVLHDAYVDSGFMTPDPSGMRVTIYHALPTTTTLCAKYDDQVVGTISLVRESALGVPMQGCFDLTSVRVLPGQIAEASALAIHRKYRGTGGRILFPLMKFMYEYCTTFFDTRHLVIAVNPYHIDMYESLLFFRRLDQAVVENYDFVNGAPAIGATLDLHEAPEIFRKNYEGKAARRDLYRYFIKDRLPNIQMPPRRFNVTNDPVLTPELMDYFFNVRTTCFSKLSERKKSLLHHIYDLPAYQWVLPELVSPDDEVDIRQHHRFSVKCPAEISFTAAGQDESFSLEVVEVSRYGFQACAHDTLPLNTWCDLTVQLGVKVVSHFRALALRENSNGVKGYYGFRLGEPDDVWNRFVAALSQCTTYRALDAVPGFIP